MSLLPLDPTCRLAVQWAFAWGVVAGLVFANLVAVILHGRR